MKTFYLKKLYQVLCLRSGYLPVTTDNHNDSVFLYRHGQGVIDVIQLIDGDQLSNAALQEQLTVNLQIDSSDELRWTDILFFNQQPGRDILDTLYHYWPERPVPENNRHRTWINLAAAQIETFPPGTVLQESDLLLEKLISDELPTDEQLSENNELTGPTERILSGDLPVITYGLITINVVIWALLVGLSFVSKVDYNSLLTVWGAKYIPGIVAGEYWRFLTPVFLHAGPLPVHLLVNCYSLYIIGPIVERLYGRIKLLIVYFAAGICGNIASFIFVPAEGIGASGAIFGLLGALLYFGVENKTLFKRFFGSNIFITIIVNAVIGLSIPGIDNFAHFGGLLGGFLAANAVKLQSVKRRELIYRQLLGWLIILVVAATGLWFGFNSPTNRYFLMVDRINNNRMSVQQIEAATEELLADSRTIKPIKIHMLWLVIEAEVKQKKYDQALRHAQQLVHYDSYRGHYLSGVIYLELNQPEMAKEEVLLAQKANPGSKAIRDLLNIIENK